MIRLIRNNKISNHVSEDTVEELEEAILRDPDVRASDGTQALTRPAGALAWRWYELATARPGTAGRVRSGLPVRGEYFAVLMGLRLRKCMPYFAFAREKYLYLFDAWPSYHEQIKKFAGLYRIDALFVSSRQAAERLQDGCHGRVCWVPEGVQPAGYRRREYRDKDIDVLEFGRKHPAFHQAVRDYLAEKGRVHLYEKEKGELVFPTRASFIDGLARARISVCFPSSITHPERAGDIETMTGRYLQSMLAGCLVVGQAPPEMVDLFGYNPVVEMDAGDPCGQLDDLLSDYERHIPLVERNYQEVRHNHSWEKRWAAMKGVMAEKRDDSTLERGRPYA